MNKCEGTLRLRSCGCIMCAQKCSFLSLTGTHALHGGVVVRKENPKLVTTYMPGIMQHVEKCVCQVPNPFAILDELEGEERWPLQPHPCVPVSHVGIRRAV